MAALALLPVETFESITQALDGFDIARLWLSGDSKLIWRLEHGAVTRFELVMSQTVNCKFPTIISRFTRLEQLRVVPFSSSHRTWFSGVDLSSISSTLTHLELDFENLESVLLGLPFVVPDAYPDPIWSPSTSGDMVLSPFSFETHFPNLQVLRILKRLFAPSFLAPMLPKSLLHLYLRSTPVGTAALSQLPPSLTYLHLTEVQEISHLPPGLIHLHAGGISISQPSLLLNIPKSMTSVSIDDPKRTLIANDWFPPHLAILSLPRLTVGAIEPNFYPSTLHHLMLNRVEDPESLRNLPSHLLTLQINKVVDFGDEHINVLPRTLTHLEMRATVANVSASGLSNLPPKLRIFRLPVSFKEHTPPYSFIPTLEELTVATLQPMAILNASKLRIIKASMISRASGDYLKSLLSLREIHVTFHGFTLNELFFQSLPGTLEVLVIPEVQPISVSRLPSSLKKLVIQFQCVIDDTMVANLPPGLTELSIVTHQGTHFTNHGIAQLPRSLYTLELDINDIGDEGINYLPPNLVQCTLKMADLLTDACVPLFPRHLTYLTIKGNQNISQASLKHFPRLLSHLSIPDSKKFARTELQDLPPSIYIFESFELTYAPTVHGTTQEYVVKLLQN